MSLIHVQRKKCACCGAELPEYATRDDWAYFDGRTNGRAMFYCSYSCMRYAVDGIESVAVVNRLKNKERKGSEDMGKQTENAKKKLRAFLACMEQGMMWDEAAAQAGYTVNPGNPSATKNMLRTALGNHGMKVPEELMPIVRSKKESSEQGMLMIDTRSAEPAETEAEAMEEQEAERELVHALGAPPAAEPDEPELCQTTAMPATAFGRLPDGMRISALNSELAEYVLHGDGMVCVNMLVGKFDTQMIDALIRELTYIKGLLNG